MTRTHRFVLWAGLLLVTVGLFTAPPTERTLAQDDGSTPARVYEPAIAAVQDAIPGIGRPDTWRHEIIGQSPFRGLNCITASDVPLPAPVQVWRVWLQYGAIEYLYYVADDGSIVQPCDPKLPASPNSDGNNRFTSECRVDAALANVRTFPDTTADNIIVQLQGGSAIGIGRTADSAWFQVQLVDTGQIGWIADSASTPVGDCLGLPVTGNTAVEYGPCPPGYVPSYLPTRLSIGAVAQIEDGEAPTVVRAQPQRSAERLGLFQPGAEIEVLDGPQCGAGFVWWRATDGNLTGWTVESSVDANDYFIELIQAGTQPPTNTTTGTTPSTTSSTTGTDTTSTNGTGTGTGTGTQPDGTLPSMPPADLQPLTQANIVATQPIAQVAGVNNARDVLYTRGGDFLAVLDGNSAELYSVPTYQPLPVNATMRSAEGVRATAIAFDANDNYLIIGFDSGFVFLVDLQRALVFRIAIAAGGPINDIAISDGNRMALAVGGEGTPSQLTVYDFNRLEATTGDIPQLFNQFYEAPVLDVGFASDTVVLGATQDSLDAYDLNAANQLLNQALDLPLEGTPTVTNTRNFANFMGVFSATRIINNLAVLVYMPGDSFAGTLNTVDMDRISDIAVLPSTPPVLVVAGSRTTESVLAFIEESTLNVIATQPVLTSAIDISPDGRVLATVSNGRVVLRGVR